MQFSLKQIGYTLKWNLIHFISDISNIPFRINLRWQVWRHGGGKNVPPEALGDVFVGGKAEEIALIRAIRINSACEKISDQLKIPEDRRQFRIAAAHHAMGKLEDVELDEAIGGIISRPILHLGIYHAMKAMGEISDNDIILAASKSDWPEFTAWLRAPVDEKGNVLIMKVKK